MFNRGGALALAAAAASLAFASSAFAQGQVLYGANGATGTPADLLVIDPATGEVADDVGPVGYSVTGLAEDPATGILYAVTGNADLTNPGWLMTIDKRTGAGTLIGDEIPATTTASADIAFTPDGTLYGWSEDTDDLVTIDKATGAATVVGNSGFSSAGSGLSSTADGTLYFAGDDANGNLFTVNRTTGLLTPVATLDGATNAQIAALAFDSAGTLFGVRNPSTGPRAADLITIDIATGHITTTGNQILRLDAIEFVDVEGRTVTLTGKKKVEAGTKVKLKGTVSAPTDTAGCAAGQAVLVERKEGGAFTPVKFPTTAADGSYSTKIKVKETSTFRAEVLDPAFCQDAVSATKKVKVK